MPTAVLFLTGDGFGFLSDGQQLSVETPNQLR